MTNSSNDLYVKVLTMAADKGLPSYIDNTDIAPLHIFSELLNSGYLNGKREMRAGLPYFINLAITIPGRQYLQSLITEAEAKTIKHKAKSQSMKFLKWVLLAIGTLFIAWLTKKFIG